MAIAPSKLGQFISPQLWNMDDTLLRSLRIAGLVKSNVPDGELIAVFNRAREEHEALSEDERAYNSPEERLRVFLKPYLSRKGYRWSIPLKSLNPWWKFWS
jgi:hypothetical protein